MARHRNLAVALLLLLLLAAVPPSGGADRPTVVFLGDSLSAGFGVPADRAFPAVAGRLLAERGLDVRIVNAGVSGDTTAGGLARLGWLLRQEPDVLVVELGANDGLRGQPLETIEENLLAIVTRAREAGAALLVLGMHVPESYGAEYAAGFAKIYGRVASEPDVAFVPGFLEGVGGVTAMNQPDGIHPTPEGHERLARNVLPALERMIRESAPQAAGTRPGVPARDAGRAAERP